MAAFGCFGKPGCDGKVIQMESKLQESNSELQMTKRIKEMYEASLGISLVTSSQKHESSRMDIGFRISGGNFSKLEVGRVTNV